MYKIARIKEIIAEKYPISSRKLSFYNYQFKKTFRVLLSTISDFKARFITRESITELQFPITNRCNFRCDTCNILSNKDKSELTLSELESILKEKRLSQVKSVGINGGEPFLNNEIVEYVELLVENLPKLKAIYIISNGFFTETMKSKLPMIYAVCLRKRIKLHLSFSLDGYGELHNKIRKNKDSFERVIENYEFFRNNREKYCSTVGLICTVSNSNVNELPILEEFCKINNYDITFNIATLVTRLYNEEIFKDFSVLEDKDNYFTAKEFFFKKFIEDLSEHYFSIFYYLDKGKRISRCKYKSNGITLNPNGDIAYCAAYSENVGNVKATKLKVILKDSEKYKIELLKKCETCVHYSGDLTTKGVIEYYNSILKKIGN